MADWFSFPRVSIPPPQVQVLVAEIAPTLPSTEPPPPGRSPDIPIPGPYVTTTGATGEEAGIISHPPFTPTGFIGRVWHDTPTFVKVLGAAGIAWLAYKKLKKT